MPKHKTTVSLTFLGSGHHRTTHETALVSAHNQINAIAQRPNSQVAAWLIDGPGCKGTEDHPMPGTYFYSEGKKIFNPKIANDQFRQYRDALQRSYNVITGEGIESSIMEAQIYLEEVITQNHGVLPKELNLQGFSRGADNCVRLANIIYAMHPSIKINLFLVDPVPGNDRRDDPESYHVPPSVQEAQIFLMLNEHKPFFAPQHQDRYVFSNLKTRVAFHYLPGRHGAGLATKASMAVCPPESQTLTQDSLLKFNIAHGALPKGSKNHYWHRSGASGGFIAEKLSSPQKQLSKEERLIHLCRAQQSYKKLADRLIVMGYHKRRIFFERERYVLDSDLFMNQEHRELFKAVFPATFNWFFEKNVMSIDCKKSYSKQDVFLEFQRLKVTPYIEFYENLLAKFHMSKISNVEDILNEPQGIARIEKASHNEPLVTDELSYLQFCLQSIASDYHYRISATWFSCGSSRDEQQEFFTKNRESDGFVKEIRYALYQSERSTPDAAKEILKKVIEKIERSSVPGFFRNEIRKIIPDSKMYVHSVLETLKRYQLLLPSSPQKALVADTISLVQNKIDNPYGDFYQKRQRVQSYLVGLNTAIHRIHKKERVSEPIICQQLWDSLNQLSRPDYAETMLQDKIIIALESYLRWRSFLSYFPLAQFFGLYNPDTISIAADLRDNLYKLKSAPEQADLTEIESILQQASSKYATLYKKAETDIAFTFWKKHLAYKKDPLNNIIQSHLKIVTKRSNLILTVQKGKGKDLDSDSKQLNRHGFYD